MTQTLIEEGSGNVFADLALPHPEREKLKAHLTLHIYNLIKERGLSQAAAAKLLKIKPPNVSSLMRCQSRLFSVERLMEFLLALDQDVEVTVRPKRTARGELRFSEG